MLLAKSIKETHHDVYFVCLLVDEYDPQLAVIEHCFDEILVADDNLIPNFRNWVFEHTVVEACTGVKGPALLQLAMRDCFETVSYIDPDIYLYSRLAEVFDDPNRGSVVLTPHLTSPALTDLTIRANELSALRHGTYNLGFISIRVNEEGKEFAQWWSDRTTDYSFDEIEKGIFTDQRWVDLAPSYFSFVQILRHPGYNFSTWNAEHRQLGKTEHLLTCNGEPLRFVHFSGLDSGAHQAALNFFAPEDHVFRELSFAYQQNLEILESSLTFGGEWAYGRFENGNPVSPSDRRAYRDDEVLKSLVHDPFHANPRLFTSLSEEPITALEARHGLTTSRWVFLSELLSDWTQPVQVPDGMASFTSLLEDLRASYADEHPLVIHFSHGAGGGSDLHVEELMKLVAPKIDSIWIRPQVPVAKAANFMVSALINGGLLQLSPSRCVNSSEFSTLIQSLKPTALHFHHLMGVSHEYFQVALSFQGTKMFTFHDFQLFTDDWRLPGSEFISSSELSARLKVSLDIHQNSLIHKEFLTKMDILLAPSAFVSSVVTPLLDSKEITVLMHPEGGDPETVNVSSTVISDLKSTKCIRLAVVGDLGEHKGIAQLKAVLAAAVNRGVAIEIFHYGQPLNDPALPLIERGHFERQGIASLLRSDGIHIGMMLSSAQETYSYALSDLLNAGLPIIASRIGAIPERLQESAFRVLVQPDCSGDLLLDAISSLKQNSLSPRLESGLPKQHIPRLNSENYLKMLSR